MPLFPFAVILEVVSYNEFELSSHMRPPPLPPKEYDSSPDAPPLPSNLASSVNEYGLD